MARQETETMTVAELIAALQNLPPDSQVWLGHASEGQNIELESGMIDADDEDEEDEDDEA